MDGCGYQGRRARVRTFPTNSARVLIGTKNPFAREPLTHDASRCHSAPARLTRRQALQWLAAGAGALTLWRQPRRSPGADWTGCACEHSHTVTSPPRDLGTNGAPTTKGPAWSAQGHYLLWSDIPNTRQLRWLEDDGRVSRVPAAVEQ